MYYSAKMLACLVAIALALPALGAETITDLPDKVQANQALTFSAVDAPGSGTADRTNGTAGEQIYPTAFSTDGAKSYSKDGWRTIQLDGHADSQITLDYELSENTTPGRYRAHTLFKIGGVADQQFDIWAGASPNDLAPRLTFKQNNGKSWEAAWRVADGTLMLFPGDRFLRIVNSGKASERKLLRSVVLSLDEPLSEGMTAAGSETRQRLVEREISEPRGKLVILEGENAKAAEPIYGALTQQPEAIADQPVQILYGEEARELALTYGVRDLPTLLAIGSSGVTLGVLVAPEQSSEVESFLANPSVPETVHDAVNQRLGMDEPSSALESGRIAQWLIGGTYSGPAGLSLWGLDWEPRIRPNPGDTLLVKAFDRGWKDGWKSAAADPDGLFVVQEQSGGYTWSKGSAYAHVYVHAQQPTRAQLHLVQSGVETFGWLNGTAVSFEKDSDAPKLIRQADTKINRPTSQTAEGSTDQGNVIEVRSARREGPVVAELNLEAGWNRVLVKLVVQHEKGDRFAFSTLLTDRRGDPVDGLQTAVADPEIDAASQRMARQLQPLVHTDAPFNLVHAGDPVSLEIDFNRLAKTRAEQAEPEQAPPLLLPIEARLIAEITDYDGKILKTVEQDVTVPGRVDLEIGQYDDLGYYAVQLSLRNSVDQLIMAYPPDGFSVIGGTSAQKQRRDDKEMSVTYYFMQPQYETLYFPYMERIGIFRNIGGSNGKALDMYRDAKERGITLIADLWNRNAEYSEGYIEETAPYVDFYKSFNEVDIRPDTHGTPQFWVDKTRKEYELIQKYDPDATFLGASFARPGTSDWFRECMKLGLDQYHDVWDVHCYPQRPPVLGGTMSNSPNETELGILKVYEELGRTNKLPFWIGETGARCSHGEDARRWQADTVTKMVACSLSREDFERIGFLVPWWYTRERGSLSDIETGHMPGEAAYYTASALIDGFNQYERLDMGEGVQAARFGPTVLAWTTGSDREIKLPIDVKDDYVIVDVVGRVSDLKSNKMMLSSSPVYVVPKKVYRQLVAM